ncbi:MULTISPECIES: type IV pilus assembly protein PilM [Deinococcus]|jgi:type IV pilus assembly protein PilM|uniref:Pilus assembly protein PilM n=2 Tax=Deinococcus soli (ex Cha et al. 2016) TaxID=1309411 RepID=A0A0F7JK63_9DEIO|nr:MULTISPECIES: type IV pilus assembly protein PilM [Deinococcus]AKH16531.1 pilus assembly protein PilM [Deinococcus soli (ex Cha et al. 2016)]MDK2011052.1 type IV pilus assembly protein PilM [Deinococcus sp. 43]MDR6217006.1 type IV pilus assembly protein PilM [Deinococcus soli (ex Cha et al. 2016)]MDR6327827.1 type IV pilus assembly protein PilM [Deinococcus soli (ex Cha et al. 2016)]MDR6750102.1 type IV pilus assembly protein PilM [Deinococcus soli (ex Cha et al. 2016)]
MSSFLNRLLSPRPNALGVEIGTSAIKVVALRPGSPPSLQHAVMVPTPIGSMRDGLVVEPQAVATELKNLLAEHRITNRFAVTSVPNQVAVTRNIMVPKMDRKDLQEAIKWEAERYIPYPIDDVSLDFDVLDDPANVPDDGQMEVVIAAAPTEAVARQVEVLRLAGLEPSIVDLKSFAALRALRGNLLGEHLTKSTLTGSNYTEAGEVALVMEIGASSSVINLVRGDRVLMARNINVSADDFTTALQKAFDLDFSAAEEVKLGYATATTPTEDEEDLLNFDMAREQYSPARVFEVVRPVLGDLITEIRRSLEFYRVQSGDVVIDRTFLAGGGAKLRGLAAAISDALGFRVEVASPWLTVQTDQANVDTGYLQANAPEFTVPLGLALRGVTSRG